MSTLFHGSEHQIIVLIEADVLELPDRHLVFKELVNFVKISVLQVWDEEIGPD